MKTDIIAIEEVGSYFMVDTTEATPTLMYSPMDEQGRPDWDMSGEIIWTEVTSPESQEMLAEINRVFGTTFIMSQFAGR
jgi:hypothetical protein